MHLLKSTLQNIQEVDQEIMKEERKKVDGLLKPQGSLGVLEKIAVQLSGIYRTTDLKPLKKAVVVCAADHGIVEEGITSAPQEVTAFMTNNIIVEGKSGVGAISKTMGADIVVVDVGVNADLDNPKVISRKIRRGTNNLAKGPAMSREEAIQSIEVGIEIANTLIEEGYNILATGEMGIGNTTPSSAIIATLTGKDPIEVTGIGANLSEKKLKKKVEVIRKGLEINKPNKKDALDVLAKVGGLEIGAMAGVMIAGAQRHIPVVIDGFISTASAAIAIGLEPKIFDYLLCSHISLEKGAKIASYFLGFEPYLDMGLRLGEGSGATLNFGIIEAAINMTREMEFYSKTEIEVI
ncbi:nicotinate-nucleotide--dimethylbenzimidazole phosphoribosyltransferase [Garciella nitratireducens]|uniref:Nicotinate-nucleotide--dimethylbenzimidazole phosphoribosyltransferase n=1 Tax=Garciella nitratireducens DSM 15102 TaxID=1121911 RepID=A0A1T4MS31_9FIRM|nr:nicotinate-nucleotide--dimethylbenzimidazole phosphoribosyltransferase [Garciella nitratireducens]SJZ69518.1 nicotinate-nucleotide-dimethylbenzimidazole phosphoribosyltransferase [Garciella nitratireducens DSM 15102]